MYNPVEKHLLKIIMKIANSVPGISSVVVILTLSSYLFMMKVNMWYGLVHRFITLLCMNFTYIFVVLSQLLWTVFFLHYCVCLKYHSVIALVDTICVAFWEEINKLFWVFYSVIFTGSFPIIAEIFEILMQSPGVVI